MPRIGLQTCVGIGINGAPSGRTHAVPGKCWPTGQGRDNRNRRRPQFDEVTPGWRRNRRGVFCDACSRSRAYFILLVDLFHKLAPLLTYLIGRFQLQQSLHCAGTANFMPGELTR